MNPKILKNPYFCSAKMAPQKGGQPINFQGGQPINSLEAKTWTTH